MTGKYFFLITFCIFFKGTFAQTAVVEGQFEGVAEGTKVFLFSNKNDKYSTSVVNGGFKFTFTPEKEWDIYFLSCPAKSKDYMFPLFLTRNSVIKYRVDSSLQHVKISGDESAVEQNNYYTERELISKQYRNLESKIAAIKDSASRAGLRAKLSGYDSELRNYDINWINTHKNSPFSVAVIRLFMSAPLSKGEDALAEQYFETLLPSAIKDNYQAVLLTQSFALFNRKYWGYDPNKKVLQDSALKNDELLMNRDAPDFMLKDTSARGVRLKDFKGKFLLIDFWASWCAPCRANNPKLKSFYNRYKNKALAVLSISVDTSATKWKDAIVKDKMNWIQASDLTGLGRGVSADYEISAVPVYFLIAPNGKIVIRSIGGDIDKIEKYLRNTLGQ